MPQWTAFLKICFKCKNCQQIYIGQTSRLLEECFFWTLIISEDIPKKSISVAHMTNLAIEKVFNPGQQILDKRESS